MNALQEVAEAVEAIKSVRRTMGQPRGRQMALDPRLPSPLESVDLVAQETDRFLIFLEEAIPQLNQLDPERFAELHGALSGAVGTLLDGIRDMLGVSVQAEQPTWSGPLSDAIEQLALAFARLGVTGHLSRTSMVTPMIFSVKESTAATHDHGNPLDLIHFIATLGGSGLSRVRLIKFIYLADVHEFQHNRRRATPYQWRFFHYGPWTVEAQQDIDTCVALGRLTMSSYVREPEGEELLLYSARPARALLGPPYSATLETALQHEVARWSRQPLNVFLNYVYFGTPPMREAKRGDYLRFDSETFESTDVIAQTKPPKRRHTTRLARAAFERLRSETPSDTVRIPRDAIADKDYERAVSALDQQDQVGDLRGDVLIEPDKLGHDPSS